MILGKSQLFAVKPRSAAEKFYDLPETAHYVEYLQSSGVQYIDANMDNSYTLGPSIRAELIIGVPSVNSYDRKFFGNNTSVSWFIGQMSQSWRFVGRYDDGTTAWVQRAVDLSSHKNIRIVSYVDSDGPRTDLYDVPSMTPIATPLLFESKRWGFHLSPSRSCSMVPFFRVVNDDGSEGTSRGACMIYRYRVREGNLTVHDFRPCVNSGNAAVFDACEGKMHYNSGSGSFVVGSQVDVPVGGLDWSV